jgi:hypothetical protein
MQTHAFLHRFADELADRPLAVLRSGSQTTQSSGRRPEAVLRRTRALPGRRTGGVGLFGGAIVPETLHFPFSRIPAGDLRDWDVIEEWSARLPDALGVARSSADPRTRDRHSIERGTSCEG